MFVNKIPFFTTVSRNIKFTTVEGIETRTVRKLVDSTDKVHALYSDRGFKLTNANLDGEFLPMRSHLQEMGILGSFATRSEHVPEIERQIRVLKERARACLHTLPFKYLPLLIVIEILNNCALWLNVFPPKGGVSTISPRTLITGVKFDYTKHCKIPFGAYAQVHEEPSPSNSQVARTVGAICLGPTGNQQGGYKYFNLRTGKRITRRKWTPLPMPHDVIARVNQIGHSQGQLSLLTFQYRHGNPIGEYDPDFSTPDNITGVPDTEINAPPTGRFR